ncbi:MAG TPA: hypothetical protein VJC16_02455 [Candidatus Nanoarchaeia archaeon]|nr:hypothetical protein [Candidatus Nanoarchaeia archaeon]
MFVGCKKCSTITAVLLLLLGVLFLLVDLGVWSFGNIQWWTALFVLMGVVGLASGSCPDCQAMRKMK